MSLVERIPDQVRRVPVSAHARHHARKYRHPLRKLALFAVRDGVRDAVRKARSKLLERRLESAQQVLVCAWGSGPDRRFGVTRDLGGTPRFHPELVFPAPADAALTDLVLDAAALALLEAYLPVPECPLAPDVATLVRAATSWLGSAAAAEGSAVAGGAAGTARVLSPAATGAGRAGVRRDRRVYLLGYGGYVREQVLPAFRGLVAAAADHKAELLRSYHGEAFPLHRDRAALLEAIAGADRPLVVIATYHSDHVASALEVLDANPEARVFVEKPAAVTVTEAEALAARREAGGWIDVGFNRRYAPMTAILAGAAARLPRPLVFSALVKELKIPASHWYRWPNQGTRVTGNLCHWIDLAHSLTGTGCREVVVAGAGDGATVSATLGFADGSLATLVATDAGDDLGGVTEHLELRAGGTTVVVDDYRRCLVLEDGRRSVRRRRRDKGHRRMYADLRRRWLAGAEPAYPPGDILAVARTTARVVAALGHAGAGDGAGEGASHGARAGMGAGTAG
jgi:predicted dehydrogenase